jgi:hypothetical protein
MKTFSDLCTGEDSLYIIDTDTKVINVLKIESIVKFPAHTWFAGPITFGVSNLGIINTIAIETEDLLNYQILSSYRYITCNKELFEKYLDENI